MLQPPDCRAEILEALGSKTFCCFFAGIGGSSLRSGGAHMLLSGGFSKSLKRRRALDSPIGKLQCGALTAGSVGSGSPSCHCCSLARTRKVVCCANRESWMMWYACPGHADANVSEASRFLSHIRVVEGGVSWCQASWRVWRTHNSFGGVAEAGPI